MKARFRSAPVETFHPVVIPVMTMAAFLLIGGCAGDGSGIPGEVIGGGGVQPTLSSIQQNVFTPYCTDCHIPGGIGPMPLDSVTNSYQSLVNQPSIEVNLLRVAPGNPDSSYLVHKIQGAPDIAGDRMPLGKPPLSADQIQAIIEWIRNGAAP